MRLSFTGTQKGMTQAQHTAVHDFMLDRDSIVEQINHGGCIGADTQFHAIIYEYCLLPITRVWPSNIPEKQGNLIGEGYMRMKPEMDPLDRNRIMVLNCDILLATPHEVEEVLRSGTWATIRYARKQRKQIVIIQPDGGLSD